MVLGQAVKIYWVIDPVLEILLGRLTRLPPSNYGPDSQYLYSIGYCFPNTKRLHVINARKVAPSGKARPD